MAYMIGEPPAVLTCLNTIELALVSTARTFCQSWFFFGGCHQHIQGWHTIYENDPGSIVGHIANLTNAGLQGQLLVVLCGPFTTTQKAELMRQTSINPRKVIPAFKWLKKNNRLYHGIQIPSMEELPIPQVIAQDW